MSHKLLFLIVFLLTLECQAATYNNDLPKDLVVTDPVEGATPPSEVNDAIRENKRVFKNQWAIVTKTGAYTALSTDTFILCNGTFTLGLPQESTVSSSTFTKFYFIKNIGSGTVTVDPFSTETIDTVSTVALAANETLLLVGDGGTDWRDVSKVLLNSRILYSPKISGDIFDTNGNELLKLYTTASAVNELGVRNAATGNAPSLEASGNDTNINIKLVPKGTGKLQVGSNDVPHPGSVAQGDILYHDGTTWARLGAGTSGQFFKTQGTGANPKWDNTIFNPSAITEFYEDFETRDGAGVMGSGKSINCKYAWYGKGADPGSTGNIILIDGDGTNQGYWFTACETSVVSQWLLASKNVVFETRWAQSGTTAGTRRIGPGAATTDPGNGIYFRHAVTANIIAVCRASSVETILDTGVAAANGTYHTGKLVITGGGTNVEVFIDGVSKGNITTNIPTATMEIAASSGTTAANTGLLIDYFYARQDR